jgi:hypothetical protein
MDVFQGVLIPDDWSFPSLGGGGWSKCHAPRAARGEARGCAARLQVRGGCLLSVLTVVLCGGLCYFQLTDEEAKHREVK